ncbi:DUF4825 domain-containing protein [Bacillus salitolerans]|uniref:DUF4825 domain-containing protein n=1 Tax=Bacillus salitolerans TaxID=1437434 RepID=A0ABW4LVQ1_9BACI
MKNITFFLCISVIVLFISGCNSSTIDEELDIFQYKNSYVGDNGAVGKITRQLPNPNGEQLNGLELKTTEELYGIILNYSQVETNDSIEIDYNELALTNATLILALVTNADWVQFNFVEKELIVTREELQNLYGKDIRQFNDEEKLRNFIQEQLENEHKVNEFFY